MERKAMGEALFYILLIVVMALIALAAYLLARIIKIFMKARRLEIMRGYETMLYAALPQIGPEKTLETLLPDPDRKALEEVLLRMGDEGAEEWKEHVIALYEMGGFAGERMRQLASPFKSRRSDAARKLGRICDPRALPRLEELLSDGSEEVEEAALYALGRIGNREALEAMAGALDRGDRWAQEKVAEAVEEAGAESRLFLLDLLADENPAKRAFAAEVLGRVGGPEEAAHLERALGDGEIDVRARAADSLGELRYGPARPALLSALEDTAWEVRSQAVKALGKIGKSEDAGRIKEALRDRQWWVRHNAAAALRDMGEEGEGPLVEALWDEDRFAAETAAQALEEGSLVERIVERMKAGEADPEAEGILRRLAEIGCVGTLCQVLDDLPEGEVRSRLGVLLSDIDHPELRKALGKPGPGMGGPASKKGEGGERDDSGADIEGGERDGA